MEQYDRRYIKPDDAIPADFPKMEDDSVLEIVGDIDGGFHFESRVKGEFDDLDLGLIPALLQEPDLFVEVTGQMERGEINEIGQSTNPRVQKLIEQYRQKSEAAGYYNPYLYPTPRSNFLQRALDGIKNGIGRILS